MGLWVMILIVALGVPSAGAFWWAGTRARRLALDGDPYDSDEMLVAFGSTTEWV